MVEVNQHEEFEHESWPWEKKDKGWRANFELLKEYTQEFGTIPTRSTVYRGVKLGAWVNIQRWAAKGKGDHKMTPTRKRALEMVQGWFWEKTPEQEWQANLELLKEYVQEFGKIPARSAVYHGVELGSWIHTQRGAAKGHRGRGKMSPERKRMLEAVPGWFWEKDLDQEWQANLELLKAYVQEFGNLPAQLTEYRGVKIGEWVHRQRQAAKGKTSIKTTPEREQALESVPGWKWW